MQYRSLKEIHTLLHSPEIGHYEMLEYRLLLIEICYLINQHMAHGQSVSVTRVLAEEYQRLARAYQHISKSCDQDSIPDVKETAILAIETVQHLLDHKRAVRLHEVGKAYSPPVSGY